MYNKDDVKDAIEMEDVYSLLDYFQADPQMYSDQIISRTVCHGGDSHKLYYYDEQQLFHCYSGCHDSFDIFELVQRVRHIDDLNQAIIFVVEFFNLQGRVESENINTHDSEDWKILAAYDKINSIQYEEVNQVKLPILNENILKYYPKPIVKPWIRDNISQDICNYMGICYDPVDGNILIPHRDIEGNLIGIRQRTLIREQEQYGKYKPWRRGTQLYNHPLGFNLYGINNAKSNIAKVKTAIVVESEKSVLQSMSYLGTANNIAVAVCGSSLSKYQFNMLLNLGVNEVVIGFDKDFEEIGSAEYFQVINKLEKIYAKYHTYANISFLFDAENDTLGYKNSPFDKGKDAFMKLWRHRIYL
jgi:hypothetical protein